MSHKCKNASTVTLMGEGDKTKEPVNDASQPITNQTRTIVPPTEPITDSSKTITEATMPIVLLANSVGEQTEQDGDETKQDGAMSSVYHTESVYNLTETNADPSEPLMCPVGLVADPTYPDRHEEGSHLTPIIDHAEPILNPAQSTTCPKEPIESAEPNVGLIEDISCTTGSARELEHSIRKAENRETPTGLQRVPTGNLVAPITKRAAPFTTRAAPIANRAAPIAKEVAPVVKRTTVTRVISTKEFLSDDLPGTCTTIRWRVALCSFFALFFSQTFRVNFTVGISCMVSSSPSDLVHGIQQNLSASQSLGVTFDGVEVLGATANRTMGDNSTSNKDDDFDWSMKTQTTLLSAYFYGYIVSQVPGGWLSRRYGTRWVVGIAMIVAMVCTALTPLCARTDVYLLFGIRVILGAAQGMGYPAVFNLTGRWIPPLETSRFLTVTSAGYPIGHILAFTVSALLCRFGFDDGWGSIFYAFDFASIFWIVAWFYMVYDTPLQHPRISQAEQDYIIARVGPFLSEEEKRQSTPWGHILLSPPVWGCAMAYFATDWLKYTIQLGLVIYMRRVLRYRIAHSGVVTALPFIVFFFSSIVVGFFADLILERNKMTRANTRRLFQAASFVPMGILMGSIGFVTRDLAGLAVAFFILSQMLFGLSQAGYLVSIVDFAPRFAGEISGMMNVVATLPGLLVPLAMAALTPNGKQAEWRNVFLIAGGIALLGTVGFCVSVRGEVQPWAEFKARVTSREEPVIDKNLAEDNEKK